MEAFVNLFSDQVINAIGWTLIHIIWKSIFIALGLFVLLLFLKRQTAKLRYFISILSLVLILVLAFVDFSRFYSTNKLSYQPIEINESKENTLLIVNDQPIIEENSFVQMIYSDFRKYFPYMAVFWIIGVLFHFIKLFGGYFYIKRLAHQNKYPIPNEWMYKLSVLKEKIDVNKIIRLLQSSNVKTPIIIGYLKPVILLPVGLISNLPASQIEAIITHELAHIKRHDYIVNIIQSVIEVLFFFHPAVWYISGKIRQEREHCCDDMALSICGESLEYAKALANIQELKPECNTVVLAFSGKKNQLLNRIKRMLMKPKIKSNLTDKIWSVVIILLTIGILTVSAGSTFDSNKKQEVVTEKKKKNKKRKKDKNNKEIKKDIKLIVTKEDTTKDHSVKIIKKLSIMMISQLTIKL